MKKSIDNMRFLVYTIDMKVDIFNYLNLVNPKLGKLYKTGRFNPFPDDFVLTEELIKERLYLSQIEPTIPKFIYAEKKEIKKYLKNSRKNIKKLIKNQEKNDFLSVFSKKMQFYLIFRFKLTSIILKEFKNQDFNENDALVEILSIDPIFSEQFVDIFNEDFNINLDLSEIEKQYNLSYEKKLSLIENKTKSKTRKKQVQTEQLNKLSEQTLSKKKEKQSKTVSKIQRNEKAKTVKKTKNKEM